MKSQRRSTHLGAEVKLNKKKKYVLKILKTSFKLDTRLRGKTIKYIKTFSEEKELCRKVI